MSTNLGNINIPAPTPGELSQSRQWMVEHLLAGSTALPFSFICGGTPGAELLAGWAQTSQSHALDDSRTQHTLTWHDADSGLEVRCVAVEYADYPVVEWTIYFKNAGVNDSPILEQIQALDVRIQRGEQSEFTLHHWRGDYNTPDSYQPFAQPLWQNTALTFAPVGGRPTNSSYPYYNLQMPGDGLIVVVGWPGQWAATFQRDAERTLQIRAGQELTHLYLKPGEEIRTPLMALLFWEGNDVARAQNIWRRWMFAHNLPRHAGGPLTPLYTYCSGGFFPNLKCDEAGEKLFIDTLGREGIKFDYWWMDAGWYPCNDWPETGTWEPDAVRFPHGLKAISDYVHARDSKLIVWFEPERVAPGTWLSDTHPEWLLVRPDGPNVPDWARRWRLLNLGNPDARQWVTEHMDRVICEQGIDLYRQDFNIDPLDFWRSNDAEISPAAHDRQGLTENLYVQGYLAYWDELRRRHPGMLIDSCASGGRRNDLETLRRGVPLLRSDYQSFQGDPGFAPGNQGHTYGLAAWVPFYGQGVYYNPDQFLYNVRSHLTPVCCVATDVRKEGADWDLLRRMRAQWQQIADCFLGDYYPLTPYSLEGDAWMAWQFNLPEQARGMVQAFRHPEATTSGKTFYLRGLDPAAQYAVMDLDEEVSRPMTGQELMETGLVVSIKDQPGAVIITYERM